MSKNKKSISTDPDAVKAGRKKRARKAAKPEQSTAQSDQVLPITAKEEMGFFVVGMGASAGGLEAFEQFFSHMPPDNGMAFVLIQHILPGYKSIMVDILKTHTSMKVLQIEDGMPVEPNCVYIKPSNKDATISNRILHLAESPISQGFKHPIDFFFQSLAKDQAEKAICIILSGAGTDGALGLKAIKDAGGMTMVQEEKSAEFGGMPASAIATGLVDYALPAEKMPEKLIEYVTYHYNIWSQKSTTLASKNSHYLGKIFALLQSKTGHNFTHYKHAAIYRRIEKRMAVNQIDTLADYVVHLQQNPPEVDALFKELLIGVTSFFRDAKLYEALKKKVIPLLFESKELLFTIRIWVVGCSRGEEAYSMAMILKEHMDTTNAYAKIQIFATDIDDDALNFARAAIYPESIIADISPERLKRFFTKQDHTYIINKQIREMVIFANHNLIKDPPFSKLDMISCRNLLIYLEPVLQKKLLPLFHYALKPNRFLILGNSETVGEFTSLFSVVDKDCKIFRRIGFSAGLANDRDTSSLTSAALKQQTVEEFSKSKEANIGEITKKMLLENYTPPCVVINEKYDIVYFQGQTSAYLKPPNGKATLNILKMAHKDLRLELRTAIQKVIKGKTAFTYKNLQIINDGSSQVINLIIRPFAEPESLVGLILVVFEDITNFILQTNGTYIKTELFPSLTNRILALERELNFTKESLLETIEELESSNEKLKTSNEMVQSINEELQSTNEELETSKEELQSMNEELITVNSELQTKIEELSETNNDINNLLSSTEIGTIFLDRRLYIKRFTPATTRVINLIEADIGRTLDHISTDILYADLVKDIKEVLKTSTPKEREVNIPGNKWYLVRILPYRTITNIIDGITINLIDITELKRAHEEIQLLQTLTLAISESEDVHTALGVTLRKICETTGWIYGEAWIPNSEGTFLECSTEWYSTAPGLEKFYTVSRGFTFPQGKGLPGRVWLSGQPEWIANVTLDANFPRAKFALEAGLKAGLAIPILSRKKVVAVIAFFMFEAREKDASLIRLISAIASQLGLVVQRKLMEDELRKAYERLEIRIEERTAELLKANKLLQDEIAERRQKEEQLRKFSHAIEQSSSSIIITDTKGKIEYVNPKFTRLTGYTPEEIIGKNPRILKSGKTPPEEYKRLWTTITSGGEWRGEFYNKKKTGEFYWESASISPIKNQEGVITHFVAIKEDITKHKQTELEYQKANESLKRQFEELQKKLN
ncbi:MAG: PAS domain S-box protein [Candidatus Brocadiaceae bacterium]|nr:PAS domain S-box protein [Candidatus Brocadiaceae bacterium]